MRKFLKKMVNVKMEPVEHHLERSSLRPPKKCEDDGANQFFTALQSKDPFDLIANSLFNKDYADRIIVIDYEIDEDCFVFAKMIESWNWYDSEVENLKNKIIQKAEENSKFNSLINMIINGEADEKSEDLLNEELKPFKAESDSLGLTLPEVITYERKPIRIKFNSPGGLINAYKTLSDVISLSKTKVIGINMGTAYSAAAFLLVACHERLALPQSRFLIHRGSGGIVGSYEQTDAAQKNYKAEVVMMINLFKERTGISDRTLNTKMNPDWYLSANEALDYHIIDRIVTDISDIM